jgi:hypothetical protein
MCLLRHTFTDTWGLDLCQIVKNNNKRETFCRAEQFGKVFLFIYKCSCFPKLDLLPQGKKVGDARCEYVFDVFDIHTVFYSELGSGHSLIFSRFAIRSPLNFFLWIADAPAFIFWIFLFARHSNARRSTSGSLSKKGLNHSSLSMVK